jgi:hypothetical protein
MLAAALASLLLTNAGGEPLEAFAQGLGEALDDLEFDFDFRAQGQIVGLTSLQDFDVEGSAEVELNASMWSFGTAVALGVEHTETPALGNLDGGFARLALQWRFFALVDRTLFRWIDPHIDLGLLLGGLRDADESWFRVGGYVGAGVDFRVLPSETHAVLTVQYRYSPEELQLPEGLPEQYLVVGFGVRVAD